MEEGEQESFLKRNKWLLIISFIGIVLSIAFFIIGKSLDGRGNYFLFYYSPLFVLAAIILLPISILFIPIVSLFRFIIRKCKSSSKFSILLWIYIIFTIVSFILLNASPFFVLPMLISYFGLPFIIGIYFTKKIIEKNYNRWLISLVIFFVIIFLIVESLFILAPLYLLSGLSEYGVLSRFANFIETFL